MSAASSHGDKKTVSMSVSAAVDGRRVAQVPAAAPSRAVPDCCRTAAHCTARGVVAGRVEGRGPMPRGDDAPRDRRQVVRVPAQPGGPLPARISGHPVENYRLRDRLWAARGLGRLETESVGSATGAVWPREHA